MQNECSFEPSIFGSTKKVKPPLENPESACVYFGPSRLKRAQKEAEARGLTFSRFLCQMIDRELKNHTSGDSPDSGETEK